MNQFASRARKNNKSGNVFVSTTNRINVAAYLASCVLFICFTINAVAQNPPNKLGLDTSKDVIPESELMIEDKLVELALKGPLFGGLENQNKINEYQLKSAKNAWLNLLTFSINYNEQSFAKTSTPNTYIYPKYFFGLTIPFGTIFSKTPMKQAQQQIEMNKNSQKQLARTVKAEVLSKYKLFKAQGEIIKLQNEIVVNEQATVNEIESKINEDSFSMEVYKRAVKALNSEKTVLINLLLQREVTKLEIEKIIGTSLESVLNQ